MLNKLFYLLAASMLLFGSCSDDKTEPIPEDADDNFVTSVVMTVDGKPYSAEIKDNTITVTVPYTVSLAKAQVEFKYTPSATIIPKPGTITDWDNERLFRVVSYNGETNEYTYRVVKDEIRHDGDAELKTAADVAAFVATGVTIVKGNLIIGSDEENAESLTNISALSLLKEVTGNIIIRNSYNGADLGGLDNITSAGGLQIGSAEAFSTAAELHMVSMKGLKNVSGDILVRNNNVVFVTFDNLASVGGNLIFSSSTLQSFDFLALTSVGKDMDVQGVINNNDKKEPGGTIATLALSKLATVGGKLSVNNLAKLIEINFPALHTAGGINFTSVPVLLETINLPEITVVNGDLLMEANFAMSTDGGGTVTSTYNNKLLKLGGLDKLTTVKGMLKISNFQVLTELPDFSKMTTLGGITLNWLEACNGQVLNLGNVNFETFNVVEPSINIIGYTNLSKISTKEDLSHVNVTIESAGRTAANFGRFPDMNFKSVKDFTNDNNNTEDPVYLFEKVYGNLSIKRKMKTGLSAPYLKSVDGYLYVQSQFNMSFEFPELVTVGGQFYMLGGFFTTSKGLLFKKLKTVCCAANPSYVKENIGSDGFPDGSLDVPAAGKDFNYFPELVRVGGVGLKINSAKSVSLPNLTTIDKTLYAKGATALTAFDMPKLTKLTGVYFSGLTKFTDFTMFGKFVKDGSIPEANWKVVNCGYNATYANMVAGQYTKP